MGESLQDEFLDYKMEEGEEGWGAIATIGTIVVFATAIAVVRWYIKGGQFREKVSAKGRVFAVTGANSGIGKQLARELNERGGKVYMLVRDVERGQQAKRALAMKYGCDSSRLLIEQCDLADYKSVRACAARLANAEPHLNALVNNAGIMFKPRYATTKDGNELVLQSNHLGEFIVARVLFAAFSHILRLLGHFLLTELLLPKLEASPDGARIVNVSSRAHLWADSSSIERANAKKQYGMMQSYARSKLAQVGERGQSAVQLATRALAGYSRGRNDEAPS